MKAGMNVIRCNMSHGDHEDRAGCWLQLGLPWYPWWFGPQEQSMKLANLEKAYELAPEFKGKMKATPDVAGSM